MHQNETEIKWHLTQYLTHLRTEVFKKKHELKIMSFTHVNEKYIFNVKKTIKKRIFLKLAIRSLSLNRVSASTQTIALVLLDLNTFY